MELSPYKYFQNNKYTNETLELNSDSFAKSPKEHCKMHAQSKQSDSYLEKS